MGNKEEVLPISICSNTDCENPIYPGDKVWKKGKDLFCKSACLIESFKQKEK